MKARIKHYFSRPRHSMFIVGAIVFMGLAFALAPHTCGFWFGLASAACVFANIVVQDDKEVRS